MSWRSRSPRRGPSKSAGPPASLLRVIDELRERLVNGRDFSETLDFFDDHVVRSPDDLFAHSEHDHNERLLEAIRGSTRQVCPGFELLACFMSEVRGAGFWHGIGCGARQQVYFFYFESIEMGLIAVCDPFDPRGLAHYMRFSVVRPTGTFMPGRMARGSA